MHTYMYSHVTYPASMPSILSCLLNVNTVTKQLPFLPPWLNSLLEHHLSILLRGPLPKFHSSLAVLLTSLFTDRPFFSRPFLCMLFHLPKWYSVIFIVQTFSVFCILINYSSCVMLFCVILSLKLLKSWKVCLTVFPHGLVWCCT